LTAFADIRRIISCGVFLGILLCSALPRAALAAELPTWVISPPANDVDALYGVGEGDDREAAKSAALAAIAGTLMTNVRSSIDVRQTVNNGNLVERVEAQVKTQVGNTELSNYQVVEAIPVSRRWWVLLRLPLAPLVDATRTQLDSLDQGLANTMARLQLQSMFEQYLNHGSVLAQIAEAQAALVLLRAASPGFDGNAYSQRYLNYEDHIAKVRDELAIRVDADELATEFPRRLVNLLADQGVRASIGPPVDGQSNIRVQSEIEDFDFGADIESKVTLRLITRDEKGNQLASVERKKVGASVSSKESARKQAENMLAREAEKQGVFTYLGLSGANKQQQRLIRSGE
jgi:hypothetical protein